jgi:hypothetical protein
LIFIKKFFWLGCWIFLREIERFLVGWSAFNPTDLVLFSESQTSWIPCLEEEEEEPGHHSFVWKKK